MSDLPKHLAERRHRLIALRAAANAHAAFYGHPVYLCGSALRDDNPEPRDWDLRLRLPDEEFTLRYGDGRDRIAERWEAEGGSGCYSQIRWKWGEDCAHKSLHSMKRTGLNIDFQVYPASYWDRKYADTPRLRLDTREDPDPMKVVLSGDPEEAR